MTIESSRRFMITSQYRRFAEICNQSQKRKNISLLYGKTGVGKTRSALHYTQWHTVEPLLAKPITTRQLPPALLGCSSAVYTPDVNVTPKRLQSAIALLRNRFDGLLEQINYCYAPEIAGPFPHKQLKLLIVDEADRLKFGSLELLRDLFDRTDLSILLIGSPGIERRLRRAGYGQLHSRLSIICEMQPLNAAEMRLFINQMWLECKLPLTADNAISSAIMRISDGNFRKLHRIFDEITRLQKLNGLPMITIDLIEMARQSLLMGNQSSLADFAK